MPEEAQTTQTTQPTQPATPAPAATPETYSEATGRTNVDESTFLPEGETQGADETEIIFTPGGEEAQPAQQATTQTTETTPTTPTTETGKPAAPGTETLLAGKYKTVDDLKSAFVQLGGDPAKYDTTEKLTEAYQVRQQEYNRWRADQDEKARQAQLDAERNNQPVQKTPEQMVQDIIGKLDMTKVENVQDLVTQLVPALVSAIPQPQQIDPNKLFSQFEAQSAERAAKTAALAQLEKDVPRLAMTTDAEGKPVAADPVFRKAFAGFLIAGNYPRNALGLQTAMKEFLTITGPATQAAQTTTTQTTESKNSAAAPTESAGKQSTTSKNANKDEADDILGEYERTQAKYSV